MNARVLLGLIALSGCAEAKVVRDARWPNGGIMHAAFEWMQGVDPDVPEVPNRQRPDGTWGPTSRRLFNRHPDKSDPTKGRLDPALPNPDVHIHDLLSKVFLKLDDPQRPTWVFKLNQSKEKLRAIGVTTVEKLWLGLTEEVEYPDPGPQWDAERPLIRDCALNKALDAKNYVKFGDTVKQMLIDIIQVAKDKSARVAKDNNSDDNHDDHRDDISDDGMLRDVLPGEMTPGFEAALQLDASGSYVSYADAVDDDAEEGWTVVQHGPPAAADVERRDHEPVQNSLLQGPPRQPAMSAAARQEATEKDLTQQDTSW